MSNAIALIILRLLRLYIRYFPIRVGKRWIFRAVIDPYLSWRPYRTAARMRAGPSIDIQLPDQIQSRIYFFGTWEPEISDYIASILVAGDCFIDVGANVGYFSLLAASIVGSDGVVCSIEASPSIFTALQRNVHRSGYSHIKLFNKAVSDGPGQISIYLGPEANRGSTTTIPTVAARKGQDREAVVPADTLSAIVGEVELLHARLIKVDIEGAEHLLLSGIAHLLPRFSPATEWLIEISPKAIEEQGRSAVDLLEMFRSSGYELYRIRNDYSDDSYFTFTRTPYLENLGPLLGETVDILARRPKQSR